MKRTVKNWGQKWQIFKNDLCEVSILFLRPQKRCSWHKHQAKYNLFMVLSGEFFIKLMNFLIQIPIGQVFTVRPGEMHEFQTHESKAIVIEIMYVQYSVADIDRKTLGGDLDAKT